MKKLLNILAIILVYQTANADEFRTWTEESTKRKIEAKIEEKDDKAGTVLLLLKSMKSVKIDVSKLVEEDRKYVKEWEKPISPQDQLTVRIVKSGISRGKRVEVDVKAGKVDVVVSGPGLRENVEAGKRELFQLDVPDRYTFTLTDSNGAQIDQETALKKTGRTDSR
jgi:hypothetical protein